MATPLGLSGAAAIALLNQYTNEPTYPTPANALILLNRAVEMVDTAIGGIRLLDYYPTVNQQTQVNLDDDVLDIVSANFSQASAGAGATPFSQGALVYPMVQLEQAAFMDAAAGFPNVGFGPPQAFLIFQDTGQAPTNTVPAPAQPQLSAVSGVSPGTAVEVVQTLVNPNGETTSSVVADFTPSTVQQVQVASPSRYTNGKTYNVYAGAVGGPYYLQNASPIAVGSVYTIPGTLVTGTVQPPATNTATGSGQGGALSMQLYPSAMIGQVNIYYRARPQLWADTSANSYTNLDTSAQEAVVLYAVMRVLNTRGRSNEIQLWKPEYDGLIAALKESMGRRIQPKSGQVRDVRDRAYPNSPYWMTS